MSSSDDDIFDAVSDFAEKTANEAMDDPLGFIAKAAGVPEVSIDIDDSDGDLSFKYKSFLTDVDAQWTDGEGSKVTANAGIDLGPAPMLKSSLVTDADGEVKEAHLDAKATIPVQGFLASGEVKANYVDTDDGFKADYTYSAGAQKGAMSAKGGTHGSFEDHGDRGFSASAGPHASVGLGAGETGIEGLDIGEVEAKTSNDLKFSDLDGQTTYGVANTTGLEGKVLGQKLASADVKHGVDYTTGPNGEQVVMEQRFSGEIGNEKLGVVASGSTGSQWTVGVDGEGNEIDRVVSSAEGKVVVEGEQPITGSMSTTYEEATGIHELLNDDEEVTPDGVAPEPQSYERYSMGEDSLVDSPQYALGEDSFVEEQSSDPPQYAMGENSLVEPLPYAMGEATFVEEQSSDPPLYPTGETTYLEEQSSDPPLYPTGETTYLEEQSSDPPLYPTGETTYLEEQSSDPPLYPTGETTYLEEQSSDPPLYPTGETTYLEEQSSDPPLYPTGETVVEEVETYEIAYEEPTAPISETVVEEVETYEIAYEEPTGQVTDYYPEEIETYEIAYEEPAVEVSATVVEEVETYEVTYEEPAPAGDSGDGLELEY